ncbi:MAG: hypothetical protein GW928_05450 [Rhodoferax sp.]|nr:hypothetical protein [Rhodoferax sp.]NCP82492.1 hypothetical protein [Rhodoferax sp.]NCS60928.1 hypothetical protein [Rhodoferax sp.]
MLSMKANAYFLTFFVMLSVPAWSADDLMMSYMVDQAHEWEQKDRPDMALDLWRKILRHDPNHQEALMKLGLSKRQGASVQKSELPFKPAAPATPKANAAIRLPIKPKLPTVPVNVVSSPVLITPKVITPPPSNQVTPPEETTVKNQAVPPTPHPSGVMPAQPADQHNEKVGIHHKMERLKLKLSDSLILSSPQHSR